MPLTKKEFTKHLSLKMGTNEKEADKWVDAYPETMIDIFKTGQGVTIPGLGGFYLKERSNGTAFKFNPSQQLRKLFGWSSTFKGEV